jgi:hypothetical protein
VAGRVIRRWLPTAGLTVAVALCLAAATTTPFTPGAEVTVAAGFVLVLIAPRLCRTPPAPAPDDPRWARRWAVVVVPLVAALAWELVCFAHGDRSAWPTASSLLGDVDTSPTGRGLAYAAWLGLGWVLVAR